jgi:hypothetical protein
LLGGGKVRPGQFDHGLSVPATSEQESPEERAGLYVAIHRHGLQL